jgi:uncharacterized protein YycO
MAKRWSDRMGGLETSKSLEMRYAGDAAICESESAGPRKISRITLVATLIVLFGHFGQALLVDTLRHFAIAGDSLGSFAQISERLTKPLKLNPFRSECQLEMTGVFESELVSSLEVGDIILGRSAPGEFVNSLITEFTRSPYSHVTVYVGDGWTISATSHGISFEAAILDQFVDVMRVPGGLAEEQQRRIVASARSTLGQAYDYVSLFEFPFLRSRQGSERRGAFICSELTAWSYLAAGIDLTPAWANPGMVLAPADIAHSEKLVWLGSWNHGERVPDARLNEAHHLQGDPHDLARAIIRIIADPFSGRDEYYRSMM